MADNKREQWVDEVINSDKWSESEKSEFFNMAAEEEKQAKQQKLEQPENNVETDEIAKLKEEVEKFNQEFPDHKVELSEGATPEQIKAVRDQMDSVRKADKTPEGESEKTEDKPAKEAMNVEGEEKKNEDQQKTDRSSVTVNNNEQPEEDWIKEKREFWQKYAQDNQYGLVNDAEKDTQEKAFIGRLAKDGKELGEIKYTSKESATISKDSSIELYQGLVKDAMANELSVTFGKSLDDKQKAMLLAACLMNKDKYKDGSELAMVNPPKIDLNAEYFKELPDGVKKVLTDHVKAAEQQKITDKLKSLREKVAATNKEGKMTEEENKARYALRQEQLATMKEQAQQTPEKIVGKDQEAVEKIQAARMGIAPHTTGKGAEIKEDAKYAQRKDQQNPGLRAYLIQKYGKSNS